MTEPEPQLLTTRELADREEGIILLIDGQNFIFIRVNWFPNEENPEDGFARVRLKNQATARYWSLEVPYEEFDVPKWEVVPSE